MGIRFLCPNGHKLNVKAFLAGQRGICPHCGERFVIPSESIKNIRVESLGATRAPGEGGALVDEDVELFDFAAQSHLVPTMPSTEIPVVTAPNASAPAASVPTNTAPTNTVPTSTARSTAAPIPSARPTEAGVSDAAAVDPAPSPPASAPTQRPFDQPDGVGGIALEIGEDFSIVPPASQANTPSAPIEDDLLAAGNRFEDLPDLEELTAAARGATSPPTAPAAAPRPVAPQTAVPQAANLQASPTASARAAPSTVAAPVAPSAPRAGGAAYQPAAPPPAPPLVGGMPTIDPISESPHAVWYVRLVSGDQFGPAAGEAMRRWLDEGRVPPGCLVWREGWPEWRPSEATFAVVAQRVPPAIPGAAPAVSAAPTARPPSPASSLGLGGSSAPVGYGSAIPSADPRLNSPAATLSEAPAAAPLAPAAMLAAKRRKAQRITALVIGLLALAVIGLVPVLIYVLFRQ